MCTIFWHPATSSSAAARSPRSSAIAPSSASRLSARAAPSVVRPPFLIGAADLGVQPIGIFLADTIRMPRKLVGDLFGAPTLICQVPDATLKGLAPFAFRRTTADQLLVVDRRLAADVVEIEVVRLLSIKAGIHGVD